MPRYIYEYPDWTQFTWNDKAIQAVFGEVRHLQGKIAGHIQALGFSSHEESQLANLTLDVVKSSEIEGERLNIDEVRSSIAQRLGINIGGFVKPGRHVEGIVDMILDATQRYDAPLTAERLYGWHAALFPTGYSGMYPIEVGRYRTREMQIISGAMGRENVHYEAVKPEHVSAEMNTFLHWINHDQTLDPVIKAAVAHFWFIIIHPFDDGNGRIARALTDMLLARSEGSSERFYSMSSRILEERKQYFAVLKQVQYSSGDITPWLDWFLHCLKNAMVSTEVTTQKIVRKAAFWHKNAHTAINERQRKVLNLLLDDFEGKLRVSKWAKITSCSTDTALRDIKDMVEKGILRQNPDGGRSTSYELTGITTSEIDKLTDNR
jgi:Fic family protein